MIYWRNDPEPLKILLVFHRSVLVNSSKITSANEIDCNICVMDPKEGNDYQFNKNSIFSAASDSLCCAVYLLFKRNVKTSKYTNQLFFLFV